MNNYALTITNAAKFIQSVTQPSSKENQARTAVILGTGLGDSLAGFTEINHIYYKDLKGFPNTNSHANAPSHEGVLVFGKLNNKPLILCKGRFHLYEGYNAQQVVMLVYLLSTLGIEELIITNASGSLNQQFKPGEVMVITDHINLTNQNPLIGQDNTFGIQFPDMSKAYSRKLSSLAFNLASEQSIPIHMGIYAGVLGPSLETSAERRYLRTIGSDVVGMSTVLEVIAANHCGLDVLGLSAICNMALGDENQQVDTIEDVLENAQVAGSHINILLSELLK